MILPVLVAFAAGVLVILSRQINGRLSLNTSALESSFWNHIVGAVALTIAALIFGGLRDAQVTQVPWWAWLGGTGGVVFIAASSWLVTRIGAAQTALLIIAGQMVSGVVIDLITGAPGSPLARTIGVALILAGMWVSRAPKVKAAQSPV
ncbi:transporter family-2 protein [Loktanella sp. DSM 29012]|uniref:DMT family transporter n=1 Tax=Loktanella sp. DSM 29012 TaxID=1881056 RepID=UPI0008B356A6|nr:DMT family transporter [Loktanella sp. DSM 29012]SEP81248.1 transporter family-2 protein [Loktanella sp. DSM 29012]